MIEKHGKQFASLAELSRFESFGSRNQCDGCARGLPVTDGLHRDKSGLPVMACTKDRYKSESEKQ